MDFGTGGEALASSVPERLNRSPPAILVIEMVKCRFDAHYECEDTVPTSTETSIYPSYPYCSCCLAMKILITLRSLER